MVEYANEIKITTRDRLLRAWENSMELVRDYETYSKEIDNEEVSMLFKKLAEDEGIHAAELRKFFLKHQEDSN